MKRSNGYLQLEFTDTYQTLVNDKIIRPLKRNKTSFYIDKLDVFFKETDSEYLEVLGSFIARELGIDTVNYDMVEIKTANSSYKGVISDSFYHEGCNLIKMAQILEHYIDSNHEEVKFNDMNIELITKAIKYRYGKNVFVNEIIDNLKRYFLLDILLGNIDNGKYNYELIEDNKIAKLTPYYDYGQIFKFKNTRLTVSDNGNYDIYDNLLEFLIKEPEYFSVFKEMYDKMNPDKLMKIFSLVEAKIEDKIKENDKNIIFLAYSRHYQYLGEVINKIKHITK